MTIFVFCEKIRVRVQVCFCFIPFGRIMCKLYKKVFTVFCWSWMPLKWVIKGVFEGYFKIAFDFSNEGGQAPYGFFEFPWFYFDNHSEIWLLIWKQCKDMQQSCFYTQNNGVSYLVKGVCCLLLFFTLFLNACAAFWRDLISN